MSADVNGSTSRTQAGWFAFGLAAWIVCGIAGVLLDQRLESQILPHRWGPNAESALDRAPPGVREEAMLQLETSKYRGGAIALGILAGSLALGLCLADAVKLRRRPSLALVVGVIVASAAGAGGGYLAMVVHDRFERSSRAEPTTTEAMMIQAVAWICAGVGIAFAVWISSRRRRLFIDTVLGGILAGGLVGAIYPTVVSLSFPSENISRLFPDRGLFSSQIAYGTSWAFLFWTIFPGVLFAVILGGVGRQAKAVNVESPPASEQAGV